MLFLLLLYDNTITGIYPIRIYVLRICFCGVRRVHTAYHFVLTGRYEERECACGGWPETLPVLSVSQPVGDTCNERAVALVSVCTSFVCLFALYVLARLTRDIKTRTQFADGPFSRNFLIGLFLSWKFLIGQ